ncbi:MULTISPECIES: sugar phosphate isomerase/epimerase family protein [unclassified Roseitalea]|uniref:sugar phosphate isomerase/epimerase family protein n=1 Tax=unclassified Roseitalea TaxID=2639107 RepID=UPI00273DF208|nr:MULTISPECIES: sugar phosphate isomerase/epimerase family protein [unclassified Roseitalea]
MRITLCNEVIADLDIADQCRFAAALGYDGLEIAPFTLSDQPATVRGDRARQIRAMAEDAGIAITGLHWLMNVPEGISLTSDDPATGSRTRDHMLAMVELCHQLGGSVIVHGSPAQRAIAHAESRERAEEVAVRHLQAAGAAAQAAGLTYCLEPLSPVLTDFVNSVDEALALIARADTAGLRTMLDTSAAWGGEADEPQAVLARHLPGGMIAHIHFNESNRRGPGQGEHRFAPIVRTLADHGYDGLIGIEPFDYHPDGPASAARAIGYVRGLIEAAKGDHA